MKAGFGTGNRVCPAGKTAPGVGTMAAATEDSKAVVEVGDDPWTAVATDGLIPLLGFGIDTKSTLELDLSIDSIK